ncbi:MAG TPA: tRNA 2-selenouridine(34) synthase MnmH [Segetibacter sp.]|jgi:tRNA 2-selenouridine synthase
MAFKKISVIEFIQHAKNHAVIDVRSPGEYIHAHIPSAYSLPLFTDEERKIVGTAYKQESREKAIKHGLEFFGTKMVKMVEQVEKLCAPRNDKTVLVHCWRGGMRSAAVAWLLDMYGFKVYTLDGGYKAFRQWVLQQFEQDYPFKIIGGYTGSGKTELLAEMKKSGEKVIDLEDLANHKGSAFGGIGQGAQPSPEMFENKLAIELMKAGNTSTETIWLEDESQRIGNINIPIEFWKIMRSRPVIFLNIPFEERLDNIVKGYGKDDKEKLVNAVIRIKKRLGGLETKAAINFLLEDNLKESFRVLLSYYDKWYRKGLESRDNWKELVTETNAEKVDAALNAQLVLALKREEQNV